MYGEFAEKYSENEYDKQKGIFDLTNRKSAFEEKFRSSYKEPEKFQDKADPLKQERSLFDLIKNKTEYNKDFLSQKFDEEGAKDVASIITKQPETSVSEILGSMNSGEKASFDELLASGNSLEEAFQTLIAAALMAATANEESAKSAEEAAKNVTEMADSTKSASEKIETSASGGPGGDPSGPPGGPGRKGFFKKLFGGDMSLSRRFWVGNRGMPQTEDEKYAAQYKMDKALLKQQRASSMAGGIQGIGSAGIFLASTMMNDQSGTIQQQRERKRTAETIIGVSGGAMMGSQMGMALGPWGALGGAVLGGALGGLNSYSSSVDQEKNLRKMDVADEVRSSARRMQEGFANRDYIDQSSLSMIRGMNSSAAGLQTSAENTDEGFLSRIKTNTGQFMQYLSGDLSPDEASGVTWPIYGLFGESDLTKKRREEKVSRARRVGANDFYAENQDLLFKTVSTGRRDMNFDAVEKRYQELSEEYRGSSITKSSDLKARALKEMSAPEDRKAMEDISFGRFYGGLNEQEKIKFDDLQQIYQKKLDSGEVTKGDLVNTFIDRNYEGAEARKAGKEAFAASEASVAEQIFNQKRAEKAKIDTGKSEYQYEIFLKEQKDKVSALNRMSEMIDFTMSKAIEEAESLKTGRLGPIRDTSSMMLNNLGAYSSEEISSLKNVFGEEYAPQITAAAAVENLRKNFTKDIEASPDRSLQYKVPEIMDKYLDGSGISDKDKQTLQQKIDDMLMKNSEDNDEISYVSIQQIDSEFESFASNFLDPLRKAAEIRDKQLEIISSNINRMAETEIQIRGLQNQNRQGRSDFQQRFADITGVSRFAANDDLQGKLNTIMNTEGILGKQVEITPAKIKENMRLNSQRVDQIKSDPNALLGNEDLQTELQVLTEQLMAGSEALDVLANDTTVLSEAFNKMEKEQQKRENAGKTAMELLLGGPEAQRQYMREQEALNMLDAGVNIDMMSQTQRDYLASGLNRAQDILGEEKYKELQQKAFQQGTAGGLLQDGAIGFMGIRQSFLPLTQEDQVVKDAEGALKTNEEARNAQIENLQESKNILGKGQKDALQKPLDSEMFNTSVYNFSNSVNKYAGANEKLNSGINNLSTSIEAFNQAITVLQNASLEIGGNISINVDMSRQFEFQQAISRNTDTIIRKAINDFAAQNKFRPVAP
jgi:hypothetical protein